MGTVAELAEEEARRAEAEADLEGEQEEQEEQTVAEPAEEPAEQTGEPDMRALEREQTRHERALRKVFGPDLAGLVPCEECGTIGYALPGEAADLATSDDYKTCEACRGYGLVLTGSRRSGNETAECRPCRGAGYLIRDLTPQPNGGQATDAGPAGERWGSEAWRGDPAIGRQ